MLAIAALTCTTTGCRAQTSERRDIEAGSIIAQLNEGRHVYVDSCVVWGDLDFTVLDNRNRIAPNLTQAFVGSSITFDGCTFMGTVKAFDPATGVCVDFGHNLSFTECDFRRDVDFTEAVVGGNVFFTGSVFRGKAKWQGAYFRHKKAYFNETQFEGDALFSNAVFAGDANFLHAVFDSTAMFQKVASGGLMFFGNAKFHGYADFSYAKASETIFKYAEFMSRYDFGYSQLNAAGGPVNDAD
jgi:uncharacterized protein YjbI with pentapeptide repeats